MRDYSVLNGMIENQKSELRTAYDKGYNQGVRDFDLILATSKKEEEGYNRGLESAWACCKRFWQSDENTCRDIFNIICWEDFFDISPSEAIKKFKEYDEKHFDVPDNCKIEVGDEIVYSDPLKGEEKGIVMGICNNWVEVKFLKSWNCVGVHKDSVKKTGRHFEQLDEILETMKNE